MSQETKTPEVKAPEVTDAVIIPEIVAPEVVAPEIVAPEVVAPAAVIIPEVVDTEVSKPKVSKPKVKKPEPVVTEVVATVLMPIIAKQDIDSITKTTALQLKTVEAKITENGLKLGKLYADGKIDEAETVNSETAKLYGKRKKLSDDTVGINTDNLKSAKKLRNDYVPSITGLAAAIDVLSAKLTEQRDARLELIENDETDDAQKTVLTTDVAIINSKMGRRPRSGNGTRKNGSYINENGSASWTAADKTREATALQVTKMREVYTDAVTRGDRPITQVMKYLISEGIVYKGMNPTTKRSDTDSNWTPVASIVNHKSTDAETTE
jgi:hypothetical protein